MRRKLNIISILLTAALSACGAQATPTLSAADVQSTAVAAAFAALTQTQEALPTATETPVPPTPTETFTPAPTNTPFPTLPPPTLPETKTNPCNEPPPAEPKGAMVGVRIVNKSDGSVNLAMGMTQENDKKECGTYNFSIARYQELETAMLAGCYWGYGWVLDPPSTARTPNVLCMTDASKIYTVWITAELVTFP